MSDTPPSFLDRREMLAAGLAGMALTTLPARALAHSAKGSLPQPTDFPQHRRIFRPVE